MSDEFPADATVAEKRDPLIGTLFDNRFEIEARLAAGGFGAIYRARDTRNGRDVALKVLHPNLVADKSVVARFRREGKVMTSLRDPHTLAAYEIGEAPDRALYIVMELLRGQTLFERLRERGPMPWAEAVAVARAICSSLAEAHKRGIVHRDLKPPNIFLQRKGESDFVKVLDFGIAKIMRGSDIDRTQLTNAGFTVGTVEYMSPEQIQGELCTERSDIYSLGLVMYEMLTASRPFANAPDLVSMLTAMLERQLPRLSMSAKVPPEVERLVMRCLAPEPKDRYKDVPAVIAAIERLANNEEPDTRQGLAKPDEEQPTWFDPRASARRPAPQPPQPPDTQTEEATKIGTFAAMVGPGQPKSPLPYAPTQMAPQLRPPEPLRPSPLQPPPQVQSPMRGSERAMRPSEPPMRPSPLQAPMMPPPGQPMMPTHGQMMPPQGPMMSPPQPGPPAVLNNLGTPGAFDMSAAAHRDAWVRRIVWIAAVVVLASVVFVLARCR